MRPIPENLIRKTLTIAMCFCLCITAQSQKMPADYFKEANKYYDAGQYDKALKGYQYFVKHFPEDQGYPRALYNVAHCQFLLKQYKQCVKTCRKLMAVEAEETDPSGWGLMDDPYANYRHRGADMACECYLIQQQWDSALHYLALSDTVYPYIHFCGNAGAENTVSNALRYAEIYEHLGQPDKALGKLLQTVFLDGLTDISKVIDELRKLLSGRESLQQELDAALDAMYEKTFEYVDKEGETHTHTHHYFSFLNVEIEAPEDYWFFYFVPNKVESGFVKEECITYIKQTSFYKMIAEL